MNLIASPNTVRSVATSTAAHRPVRRIAIIGSGVSGLVAARLLSDSHEIHVFEASDYAGGHANTVDIELADQRLAVDTGFMVFNERTYPNFCRLLRMLQVSARDSDMSFSVQCSRSGLEYQGSSFNGLFAQRINLVRPSFWRMLADIMRFNAAAGRYLHSGVNDETLGQFLDRGGYTRAFRDQYLLPMIAAIWSARPGDILSFPTVFLLRFLENHGLLQIRDRPIWKTIRGGSRNYVKALIAPFAGQIRYRAPVSSVTRHEQGVAIASPAGVELFDAVVLATHADDSLRMLTDADSTERAILDAFPYQANEAVLHTDQSLLPQRRRAWASWNYYVSSQSDLPASVTYDLSRLQRIRSAQRVLVSLNPTQRIDPARVLGRFSYRHPVFSLDSLQAQRQFDQINGRRRTYFCGAYRFNGFHEDGVASALEVCAHFGRGLHHCEAASTKAAFSTAASIR